MAGDLRPDRVHQILVEDAVLAALPLVDHPTGAGEPCLPVEGGGTQHGIRQTGSPQDADLRGVYFLATKIRRIAPMGIDEGDANSGPPQHGRGKRPREPAPGDCNIHIRNSRFQSITRECGTTRRRLGALRPIRLRGTRAKPAPLRQAETLLNLIAAGRRFRRTGLAATAFPAIDGSAAGDRGRAMARLALK